MTKPLTFHPGATAAALAKLMVERHVEDAIHLVADLDESQRAALVDACLDQLDSACHDTIRNCRNLAASSPELVTWPANLAGLAGLAGQVLEEFFFYVGPETEDDYDDPHWTRRYAAGVLERTVHHQLLVHPEPEPKEDS
ncbi:MAG: hypothetical protein J2P58_01805 [Acidimicrobiaceae bacterium]|nr:hypothetical protein [Acidimicrobiaceae bacterium]